ncbi:CsbD family protein [Mycolicibacterium sp. BiH015]|uniref:CsbD family protein n=1 Tax=Mycolicibacterium sp. BiH015 TaxID=3018808 RepID=UPI0022E636EC|nr:CsbD family protein [Mycolicibacterium sp. BiH015]MDA2891186.1 CsbD family protein [Mycolicibacterium sp. BiH015]
MSENDKAGQAREGLLDSVKGKAKEIAGAVIGNDSLTKEGQLDQAQARERKEANITEAVAEAELDETREDLVEAKREAAQARSAVDTDAAAAKLDIQHEQQEQKRAAEQQKREEVASAAMRAQVDAQQEVQQAKNREEAEKEAARDDLVEATAEHQTAVKVTENAKSEAERLREHADEVSKQADLP